MTWDEKKDIAETEIRGRVITMAADIEFSLFAIIAYCAPDPCNQIRKFRKATMWDKIEWAKTDLQKHKPTYFERYKADLDKLEEFRIVRNDFAHHTMEFHQPETTSIFRIRYVDLLDGKERVFYKEYNIEYLRDYVNRCRALNMVLARLVEELKTSFVENQKI